MLKWWKMAGEHKLLWQAAEFACSTLLGVLLGAFFHFYNLLLRYLPLPRILVWLGDITVWLAAALMAFIVFLVANRGEVRFFHLLGMLLGAGIYMRYHPAAVEGLVRRSARGLAYRLSNLKKGMHGLGDLIARPMKRLASRLRLRI